VIDVVGDGTELLLNNRRWELVLNHSRAMCQLLASARSTAGICGAATPVPFYSSTDWPSAWPPVVTPGCVLRAADGLGYSDNEVMRSVSWKTCLASRARDLCVALARTW
jgi:hypothetical protein